MDATEDDQDIKLQRQSADLLDDFQRSLKPFLWKTLKSGNTHIRNQVRARDTQRLVNLLEPFQELPQLLDPHLDRFVPLLADAFLAYLQAPPQKHPPTNTQLLMPLSKAICKLLYTFCKIRGDKVIVRFWSTEAKHLEVLLTAIEAHKSVSTPEDKNTLAWDWEERYVTLLWLSQLLLAPFDLVSISSLALEDITIPDMPGFVWPENVPTITLRAISLGIQYLSSSGKERDAAKVLLVRIAMRRDMQSLGIQDALMKWAMSRLQSTTNLEDSTYHSIGVLSFLAAILISSVGTTNMDSFVEPISQVMQSLTTEHSALFGVSCGSAVARKAIVKILRTLVVLHLQNPNPDSDMVASTIGHMLESLADSATPVRLAASKALSIITLKLPLDMAGQVVEEVLDTLKKDILWTQKSRRKTRNLSRVNPLEWHGLTLTLSHLVYRQSIPPEDLAPVLDALRLALSFNQRSPSGSSIGTNVRDAACFGIWAVARRYKTEDLQILHLSPDITTESSVEASVSALQTLANDLVVSACVDPAGNIRRGSSAALQELIGRHPNTISEGIQVVQVVDYHAVALRTRAISEVAEKAAQLSEDYREAILQALLGWRGVRDANPATRKAAASSIGSLVWQRHLEVFPSWRYVQTAIDEIATHTKRLEAREISELHGLVLAFSSVVAKVIDVSTDENIHTEFHRILILGAGLFNPGVISGYFNTLSYICGYLEGFLKDFKNQIQNSRQHDILAHAFSELTTVTSRIPRLLTLFTKFDQLRTAHEDSQCDEQCWIRQIASTPLDLDTNPHENLLEMESSLIGAFMKTATQGKFEILSVAAESFLMLESGLTKKTPHSSLLIGQWAIDVVTTRSNKDLAYIYALVQLYPLLQSHLRDPPQLEKVWVSFFPKTKILDERQGWLDIVLHAVLKRWENDLDVQTRAIILQCLARPNPSAQPTMLQMHTDAFMKVIEEGLQDFTTNARGDVGSLVRIAAAQTATAVLSLPLDDSDRELMDTRVVGGILRISAEKLDKVRIEGQKCLARLNEYTTVIALSTPSSQAYFLSLLTLQNQQWWLSNPRNTNWARSLMEGYVTSADTGSEDLIRASRAALVEFCRSGHSIAVCHQLIEMCKSTIDRVLIPTLEVIGFLFDMQIMQTLSFNWESFYNTLTRTHFKSTNVRKLSAVIKIYGGLIQLYPDRATEKLSSMLLHGYPQIRNAAADELWIARGVGKGVDWGRAGRGDLVGVRGEMELMGRGG